jgi:hypothetical protein
MSTCLSSGRHALPGREHRCAPECDIGGASRVAAPYNRRVDPDTPQNSRASASRRHLQSGGRACGRPPAKSSAAHYPSSTRRATRGIRRPLRGGVDRRAPFELDEGRGEHVVASGREGEPRLPLTAHTDGAKQRGARRGLERRKRLTAQIVNESGARHARVRVHVGEQRLLMGDQRVGVVVDGAPAWR